jgi:hypothetical protein
LLDLPAQALYFKETSEEIKGIKALILLAS